MSSVLVFFVLRQKYRKQKAIGLQRIGYHVMHESVNGVAETALILASLTADNYRAEQLSAKVASMRTCADIPDNRRDMTYGAWS